jgi:glycosyltransferase involved in cell wall biosynthesis
MKTPVNPLVSVIVTTFNREQFLKETIQSILNQSFTDFELIVVDQFSSYGFFALIDQFKSDKIRAYQNNKLNDIISVNRNYALKQAKGKYIAFCDDDDIWHTNKLEKQVQLAQSMENTYPFVLVHSNTILFGEGRNDEPTNKSNVKHINDFISSNQITFSTAFVTKSHQIIFNEEPAMRASEDYNLWIELLLHNYHFLFIEEPLLRYRVGNASASNTNKSFRNLQYIVVLTTNIVKYKVSDISVLRMFKMIVTEYLKFAIRLRMKK